MSCRSTFSAGGVRPATDTAMRLRSELAGDSGKDAQAAAPRQQTGLDSASEVGPSAAEAGPATAAAGACLCAPGTRRAVGTPEAADWTQCPRPQPDHGWDPAHPPAARAPAPRFEL